MKIYILQGSVETRLRYGGILSNQFITNFPQNVQVKNFENRSIFGEDMDKSVWLSFLAHPVYCVGGDEKHCTIQSNPDLEIFARKRFTMGML